MTERKTLLGWSSGKDSAWALHLLRHNPSIEMVGLVTTFNEAFDRVAMHGVRRELVERQAAVASLPLWPVMLPQPCPNEAYEQRMAELVERARNEGVTHFAFGDLHLRDVREYRERMLAGTGITPLFPLWGSPDATRALASEMIAGGLRAVLTCVDPKQLSATFAGRQFDDALLRDLPPSVDPCGEKGEFHTFCYAAPCFAESIAVAVGEAVERDGFQFIDVAEARALS